MATFDKGRGRWRITIDVAPPGGRRERKTRDVQAPNTKAGRKKVALVEAEMRVEAARAREAAWPGRSAKASFGTVAAGWMERNGPRWSPKTLKEHRYALARYILPTLGPIAIDKVSPVQIESLYATWASAYSPSTTRRWHGIIRAIYADAERLGLLGSTPNPMSRVRPAGGHAKERPIPSPVEIRRVIDAAPNPHTAVYFELAAATGARRGTLVALRWRDIDTDTGHLSYVEAVAEGDEGEILKTNKAGRAYSVTLAGAALERLRAERRRAAETILALGTGAEIGDLFVFSDDGGANHWNLSWPSHAWANACRRAGVGPFRLHDVRHFAATRLLAQGVPVRVVADRLGCTEGNIIRTYSHRVASPEDARAAQVMADVLEIAVEAS